MSVFATRFLSVVTLINHHLSILMVAATLFLQMGGAFGMCMAESHAFALAVVNYQRAIGTASIFFWIFLLLLDCSLDALDGIFAQWNTFAYATLFYVPHFFYDYCASYDFKKQAILEAPKGPNALGL